jgi:hypothetical protein
VLVLGAGASHGVIPITRRDITALARELLEAGGDLSRVPPRYRHQVDDNPDALFLVELLRDAPRDAWDRMLAETISPSQASYILHETFTPRHPVPRALTRIFEVIEPTDGTIVSFNYDRVTDAVRSRFRVIAPHGERSSLLSDPSTRDAVRKMAIELHIPPRSDWWLPVPETVEIQQRPAYQQMVAAWRLARSIIFIGYGFGGGDDALSFEDFGRESSKTARTHVLCPNPDNRDLCKQVGYALRGRGPRFRVFGHPYRWRSFAEAVLEYLTSRNSQHISAAIGAELEITFRHDRK